MSTIQKSITSITKEHTARRHLALAVCMIAVATVLAVFWSLHIKGITLASGDLICGMEEHTHTADCYAWVPVTEDTEESTEPEELSEGTEIEGTETEESTQTEVVEKTAGSTETEAETETTVGTAIADTEEAAENVQSEAGAETGTESLAENGTEALTEAASEALTEEENEAPQVGDVKIVYGVEYVYTLICGMEEHTHTEECYADEESEGTEAEATSTEEVIETDEIIESESEDESEKSTVAGGISSSFYSLRSGNAGSEAAAASLEEEDSGSSGNSSGNEVTSISEEANGGLTATASSSYYFADTVALSDIVSGNDYVVYTVINNVYYLVGADGTLTACNSSSSSDTINWSDGTMTDYTWTVTTDNNGYYIYNSTSATYLSPEVKETSLSGKNEWWNSVNESMEFTFSEDGTYVYNFVAKQDDNGGLTAEVYDNTGTWYSTSSNLDAWGANDSTSSNILKSLTWKNGSIYSVICKKKGSNFSICWYQDGTQLNETTGTLSGTLFTYKATVHFGTITVYASNGTLLETYTYYKETKQVSSTGAGFVLGTGLVVDYDTDPKVYEVAFVVLNAFEYELASTGDTGITYYMFVGKILVFSASAGLMLMALYYCSQKRKIRKIIYSTEYTENKKIRQKCFARMRGHPLERSVTRGHARDRPSIRTVSSADGNTERSRGTGPGKT